MKKSDKLHIYWSGRQKDIILHYPEGRQTVCDIHYLNSFFNSGFIEEIQKRGYDITTVEFSIEPQKGNNKFISQRPRE